MLSSLGNICIFLAMIGVFFTTCRAEHVHVDEKLGNQRDHILVEPTKPTFWCPTCQNKSQETCDANLRNTSCPKAQFCMALWDKSIFVRKCVNKPMLDIFTRDCKIAKPMSKRHCVKTMTHEFAKHRKARHIRNNRPSNRTSRVLQFAIQHCKQELKCHVRSCGKSGCKADVAKMIPPHSKFWCPTCPITNSSSECDLQMEMTNCPRATMCIALRSPHYSPGKKLFTRKCVNYQMLSIIQDACKKKGCEVASCTKAGCEAKF